MKKLIAIIILSACIHFCHAQAKDYNVVFDLSTSDSTSQKAVIRQVTGIKNGNPDAKLEVVVFGQGLDFVLNSKSAYKDQILSLVGKKDVTFKVCNSTMKRLGATKADLIPGVEIVQDGIYEIILKQKEGWGYIKVAQ